MTKKPGWNKTGISFSPSTADSQYFVGDEMQLIADNTVHVDGTDFFLIRIYVHRLCNVYSHLSQRNVETDTSC